MRAKSVVAVAAVITAAAVLPHASPARASTEKTLFFHSPTELGKVDEVLESEALGPGPSMDTNAPTGTVPKLATTEGLGNTGFRKNQLLAYWGGAVTGVLTDAKVRIWVSSQLGETLLVRLFGDGIIGVTPPIASQTVTVPTGIPTELNVTFTGVNTPINDELVVQVVSRSQTLHDTLDPVCSNPVQSIACGNTDTEVLFDSVDYPSAVTVTLDPLPTGTTPTGFANYAAPEDNTQGLESAIGWDGVHDTVMGLDSLTTLRVNFDDTQSPPKATWRDVSATQTKLVSSDAIMWVDPVTGRTFVAQLAGPTSLYAFSDDDGATWTTAGLPDSLPAVDHETIGGGPYSGPKPATLTNSTYPDAVYYCAQGRVEASCARSDDGGFTWGVPIPFNTGQCGGLHGHVTVGPDGTVYIPNKHCNDGRQGVFISKDNGETWSLSTVPGTRPGNSDPKVTVDAAGRVYFVATSATASGGMIPVVATSNDDGSSWSTPVDVGASLPVRNAEQPAIVAGSAGRAAAFFYGTGIDGDDQASDFAGVWYVYVAFTYDGGATWSLVEATHGDPVQRGTICLGGITGCGSGRNLLDFQDMTIDGLGRVLVSYADGCTSAACKAPTGTIEDSTDAQFTIARQTTGGLLRA